MESNKMWDPKQIGLNVSYYRKKRKITQQVLCEKVDISRTHMSRIETGQSMPSISLLYRLAEALDVEPGKLTDEKE